MTSEEALEGLIKERDSEKANRDIWDEKEDKVRSDRYVEMLNIAIKALEQRSVLGKIRAEIVDLGQRTMNDNRASGIWACRDIIDKYREGIEEE